MRKWFLLAFTAAAGLTAGGAQTPNSLGITADELRVRAAVLDYAEGIYEREASRLARSLHPDVRRHIQTAREGRGGPGTLDYDDLLTLASRSCNARVPRSGPKRIVLYALRDNVAKARLTAAWGEDVIHLTKEHGRWRIVGIVGSASPESARRPA